MARYSYRAVDAAGRRHSGQTEAANIADLELRLKRLALDLLNAEPLRELALPPRKVSRRELIKFCFHLEQLSRAGVPLIEALVDLRDSLRDPRFREVVANIVESIEGGKTLSQAMAAHPRIFDEVFVSLVMAGENSGTLPDVLKKLVEATKWQDELAARSRKLLLYPATVGGVVLGVSGFALIYLVPRLVGFMQGMGQQLPAQTRWLLAGADFLCAYWVALLLAPAAALALAALLLRRSAAARYHLDQFKLSLPVFGSLLRKMALSRFAAIFAIMYAAGISIIDALRSCETVVGNAVIRKGLVRVGELIADGHSLTAAFASAGLFPPLVVRMLRVGENSGGLDTALLNVSYFYDRDVEEAVERLQALVEPVLTLLLGLILGSVMLAAFGPLYDILAGLGS